MKKNILLGVTASVAVYKSCDLARRLIKSGFTVKVVMTPNATKLISPVLFRSLTGNKVYVDMFDWQTEESIEHISLAKWADLLLIVPATANTLAKLVYGLCDNLLTSLVLALPSSKPVVVAPAMNTNMWDHPATKNNADKLAHMPNYTVLGPVDSGLACGDKGMGALVGVDKIVEEVGKLLK